MSRQTCRGGKGRSLPGACRDSGRLCTAAAYETSAAGFKGSAASASCRACSASARRPLKQLTVKEQGERRKGKGKRSEDGRWSEKGSEKGQRSKAVAGTGGCAPGERAMAVVVRQTEAGMQAFTACLAARHAPQRSHVKKRCAHTNKQWCLLSNSLAPGTHGHLLAMHQGAFVRRRVAQTATLRLLLLVSMCNAPRHSQVQQGCPQVPQELRTAPVSLEGAPQVLGSHLHKPQRLSKETKLGSPCILPEAAVSTASLWGIKANKAPRLQL